MVQGTQSRVGRRSRPATLLLGIEGLAVVAVDRDEQGVRVVQVVTDDDTAAAVPGVWGDVDLAAGSGGDHAAGHPVR